MGFLFTPKKPKCYWTSLCKIVLEKLFLETSGEQNKAKTQNTLRLELKNIENAQKNPKTPIEVQKRTPKTLSRWNPFERAPNQTSKKNNVTSIEPYNI